MGLLCIDMKGEIVIPGSQPDHTCAWCQKGIAPAQAHVSLHSTHGSVEVGGIKLCRKHLDGFRRDNLETGWFAYP